VICKRLLLSLKIKEIGSEIFYLSRINNAIFEKNKLIGTTPQKVLVQVRTLVPPGPGSLGRSLGTKHTQGISLDHTRSLL
jgi:hypothetical protein